MKREINWGIMGLGKIAHKFAHDLQYVTGAKLHAVAATDHERAADFARKFGATYHFSSYEALLNCPHLDVVYIATPHVFHHQQTMMCLKRRIPVLCEKPLAINTEEVAQMIDTAHSHHTFLMEAMWSRFVPAFQKALAWVAQGRIGTPLSMRADFSGLFPFDPQNRVYNKALGGGALLDIGIYPIMLAQSIFGAPQTLQSLATIGETGVDVSTSMQFQYADGGLAQLFASVQRASATEAFIYGEKGMIHLPPRFHHPHKVVLSTYNGPTEVFEAPFEGFGYQFEAQAVTDCLALGQLECAQMSHAFSLTLMQTLDAVRQQIGLFYDNHDCSSNVV